MARTKQNRKSIGRKSSRKQPTTKAVWKSVLVQEVVEIPASRTSGDYHEHEDQNGTRRRRAEARRRPAVFDGKYGSANYQIHSRNYDENNEVNYTEKGLKEGRIRKMTAE
ncbi:hypothetical protein E3N88_36403 [Mikania micrantha]|uniref:Uncharacterized protein n=1 Tax=Mikania micrantha TaxID=192012 RepID=A0A5N6M6E4_9ASTR|nr:hypothetical protein E3N88_36403 [Mikania micrantha]